MQYKVSRKDSATNSCFSKWEGPPGRDIINDPIPINILVVFPIDIATRWCVALEQSPVGRLHIGTGSYIGYPLVRSLGGTTSHIVNFASYIVANSYILSCFSMWEGHLAAIL